MELNRWKSFIKPLENVVDIMVGCFQEWITLITETFSTRFSTSYPQPIVDKCGSRALLRTN